MSLLPPWATEKSEWQYTGPVISPQTCFHLSESSTTLNPDKLHNYWVPASAPRQQQDTGPVISLHRSLHLSDLSTTLNPDNLHSYPVPASAPRQQQGTSPCRHLSQKSLHLSEFSNNTKPWQLTLPNASFSTETAARHPPSCLSPEKSSPLRVFKGNVGETSERRGGTHMDLSERIDTI